MKIKRLLYLAYYFKNLDTAKFKKFIDAAVVKTGKSKGWLYFELLGNSLTYNISILEYFLFGFHRGKTRSEKETYAGTGFMYEYQKVMNPPHARTILDDKRLFYKKYNRFFKHHVFSLNELVSNPELGSKILDQEQFVLKESKGKCGLGTAFFKSRDFRPNSLIQKMQTEGFDLAETYIQQHEALSRLSPSGVNTVRIFTQLNSQDEVEILGCRQRISVDSPLDNLAAGNLAAPIDEQTGVINGPGIYSDITKAPAEIHPITGVPITGFQIPFWQECLKLAKDAAVAHPQNRSVGWDIVVTESGPGLIEGNHDWCKLVWQLPINKGLKPILEKHLSEWHSVNR